MDNPQISWKWDTAPPLLAMIFEPGDKETKLHTETYEGESHEYVDVRYRATAKQAISRLEAKGLSFDRVKRWVASLLGLTVPELESSLASDEAAQEFEEGKPKDEKTPEEGDDYDEDIANDPTYAYEVLTDDGYFELAALLSLWPALLAAKPEDAVMFDGSDAALVMDSKEILETDFVKEARDALQDRLNTTSALLEFLRRPTPEAIEFVKDRLAEMSEDDFLRKVVVPVLEAEGYQNVKVIQHHGPTEFGTDLKPMRKSEMGKWYYEGAQAKAERIDQDMAPHVWAQIETAFGVKFSDEADNTPKSLDRMYLFMAKGATTNGLRYLQEKSFGRTVRFFDPDDIAALVLRHDLLGNLT